jgi:hypothetical protein
VADQSDVSEVLRRLKQITALFVLISVSLLLCSLYTVDLARARSGQRALTGLLETTPT